MIISILIKIFGGILRVKNRISKKSNYTKWFLLTIYRLYLDRKNSYIGLTAQIDKTVIFPHGINGIFISGDAVIGKNCVIFQQVTIGSNTIPTSATLGAPKIGNNCYIGAGAKIIGAITVGDNCRIGANCVVVIDIPDNSLVVMEKPKVITKEGLDNHFYQYSPKLKGWVFFQDGKKMKVIDDSTKNKLADYKKLD